MTDAPAFLYESFPATSFGGNIAGVVLLEHPASESWMQGVAADLNAPTSGFVDLPSARQGCAEVRFFTPQQEIDACGHVTVAIATALSETGRWDPGKASVQAAGGSFGLLLRQDEDGVIVEMRQQLQQFEPLDYAPDLASILGTAARKDERYPVVLASTGLRHMLVPVHDAAALAQLPMIASDIATASHRFKVDTIGVWAFEAVDQREVRVRMRDLCAAIGVVEEPASGTTSGALALALASANVLTPQRPRLIVTMGVEMGRPSLLSVDVDFDGSRPSAARLLGRSRLVFAGRVVIAVT
jgi:trans-2,3-dihydro-3-hydroxyanthranilate isomerase